MRFKNIAKVSDYNYRNYKADFQRLCSIGEVNLARNTYKQIFTTNEMIYMEHTWFSRSKITTYEEDGILFQLMYKTKSKNEAIKQTKIHRYNGYYSRVKHFYDDKGNVIEYGVLRSFVLRKGMKEEEPYLLNPVKEYTNICSKCGAKNTLYIQFKGRNKYYRCEKCGEIAHGITKKRWDELQKKKIQLHLYHSTPIDLIPSIMEKGLIAGYETSPLQTWKAKYSGKGIYFYSSYGGLFPIDQLYNGVIDEKVLIVILELKFIGYENKIISDEEFGNFKGKEALKKGSIVYLQKKIPSSYIKHIHIVDINRSNIFKKNPELLKYKKIIIWHKDVNK